VLAVICIRKTNNDKQILYPPVFGKYSDRESHFLAVKTSYRKLLYHMLINAIRQESIQELIFRLQKACWTPARTKVIGHVLKANLKMPLFFQSQGHIAKEVGVSRQFVNEVLKSVEGVLFDQKHRFYKANNGRMLQRSSSYRLRDEFRMPEVLNKLKSLFPFLLTMALSAPIKLSFILLLGHLSLQAVDSLFQKRRHVTKNVYIKNINSTKYNFDARARASQSSPARNEFAAIGALLKQQFAIAQPTKEKKVEAVVELKRKFSFLKQGLERAAIAYQNTKAESELSNLNSYLSSLGNVTAEITKLEPSFDGAGRVMTMVGSISKMVGSSRVSPSPTLMGQLSNQTRTTPPAPRVTSSKREVDNRSAYDKALDREELLHTDSGKTILSVCGNVMANPILLDLSNVEISGIFKAVHEHCTCNRDLLSARWKEVGEYKANQRRTS
jgi:hypothetical protein